jgi:hypothetical protein
MTVNAVAVVRVDLCGLSVIAVRRWVVVVVVEDDDY